MSSSYEESWKEREPWVVVDPDHKREWVLIEPVRYYITTSKGEWFVCDRWLDLEVPGTKSNSRTATIRSFYKWCGREIPEGTKLGAPMKVVHHEGIG